MICRKQLLDMLSDTPVQDADDILLPLFHAGMISESDYNQLKEEMTRKEILANHKAAISQHKDGRWRTYVPTPSGKIKLKVRTTRDKLEDDIVAAYKAIHKIQERSMTLDECYWK